MKPLVTTMFQTLSSGAASISRDTLYSVMTWIAVGTSSLCSEHSTSPFRAIIMSSSLSMRMGDSLVPCIRSEEERGGLDASDVRHVEGPRHEYHSPAVLVDGVLIAGDRCCRLRGEADVGWHCQGG